jgi:hypothetical protein
MGRALYHLVVGDALRHQFCCPDSRLELLGPALRLEPGKVLFVWLGRQGVVVADVPGGVFPRDPHVPQHARGLGDLPLAVVSHEADLGVFTPTVVGRADLTPEVHRAHLPLLLLVLSLQRDVRRQAPQVRGLGSLDQLGQFG